MKYNLEALRDGVGKIHDIRVEVTDSIVAAELVTQCPHYVEFGNCSCSSCFAHVKKRTKDSLSATVKYRYALPESIDTLIGRLQYILTSALGVDPLKTSSWWNLVPFSFVLDWLFNTERILQHFNFADFEVSIEIVDICVVWKQSQARTVDCTAPCNSGSYRCTHDAEFFRRWVGRDALTQFLPWFFWPTEMQQLLGTALVLTML
jgi:hypothetical protein